MTAVGTFDEPQHGPVGVFDAEGVGALVIDGPIRQEPDRRFGPCGGGPLGTGDSGQPPHGAGTAQGLPDEALSLIESHPEVLIDGELLGQGVAILSPSLTLDPIMPGGGVES
jgi:hypothetical protein